MSRSDLSFAQFLFYFFKIFGLATMSITFKFNGVNNTNRSIFVSSRNGLIFNVFLICSLLYLGYICVEDVYCDDYYLRLKYDRISETFQTLFSFLVALVIIAKFSMQQEKVVKISNQLYCIAISIMNLRFKKCEKSHLKQNICVILFIEIIFWVIIIFGNLEYSGFNITIFLQFFPSLIINFMTIQFTAILRLILELFATLNFNFQCVPNRFVFPKRLNSYRTEKIAENDKIIFFNELRLLYLSLCEMLEEILNLYVFLLLLTISYMFTCSVSFIYYPTKAIIVGYPLPFLVQLSCWIWIVSFVFKAAILTSSASQIVAEVNFSTTNVIF